MSILLIITKNQIKSFNATQCGRVDNIVWPRDQEKHDKTRDKRCDTCKVRFISGWRIKDQGINIMADFVGKKNKLTKRYLIIITRDVFAFIQTKL